MSLADDVAQICARYNVNFIPGPVRADVGTAGAQLMADLMRLLTITLERRVCTTARPPCNCLPNGHMRFDDPYPIPNGHFPQYARFGGCPQHMRFGDRMPY